MMTSLMTSLYSVLTFLLLLLTTTRLVRCSQLRFTADPQDVSSVSETLQMRCSVHDSPTSSSTSPSVSTSTPQTSAGLVGRAVADNTFNGTTSSGLASPEDVNWSSLSTSGEEMNHVGSITITRGGVAIATVSQFTPATLESDPHKVNGHVTGDVSKVKGELGYLELEWDFPSDSLTGHYECRASGYSDSGHAVTLSRSLDVSSKSAVVELEDPFKEVRSLKEADSLHLAMIANATLMIRNLEALIIQQQTKLDDQEIKINDTRSKVTAQIASIADQQATINAQQGEIAALGDKVKALRHVETGSLRCGPSTAFSRGTGSTTHNGRNYFGREKQLKANFLSAYTSPPVVFMSQTYVWQYSNNHNGHGIQLMSVTNESFTMRCGVPDNDSFFRLYDFEIQWIAVPV